MQDILIHVRDIREHTQAGHFGLRLAAAFGAGVTGIYVYPTPIYLAPAYSPGWSLAIQEGAHRLENDALQARQPFLDWAASLGVPHADWIVAEGNTAQVLAQAAMWHDFVVLDHAPANEGPAWDVPELILKAGVPCIVTPHHGVHYSGIERIAVGWNGSPEATRALRAALPFMRDKKVLLMSGELRDTGYGAGWKTPFDAGEYLKRHGIEIEQHTITAVHDDAGTALLEEAMRFRADLLVMGAYGRNRFSEWMLGGATRHVLTWADMPLLLCH